MDQEFEREKKKASIKQAVQGRPVASWASIFLDYFDLKARLLAIESKEPTGISLGF